MPPITPHWPRHAALFVLAHKSAQHPRALPGTPIGGMRGGVNWRPRRVAVLDASIVIEVPKDAATAQSNV